MERLRSTNRHGAGVVDRRLAGLEPTLGLMSLLGTKRGDAACHAIMFTPGAAARLDELLVALASLVANGDYDPVEEGSKAISAQLYAAADARTVLHGSVCQPPGTLPSPDSCFTNYVKVAFFRGTSLRPVPPSNPRARTRATATSMRTTSSTKLNSPLG